MYINKCVYILGFKKKYYDVKKSQVKSRASNISAKFTSPTKKNYNGEKLFTFIVLTILTFEIVKTGQFGGPYPTCAER